MLVASDVDRILPCHGEDQALACSGVQSVTIALIGDALCANLFCSLSVGSVEGVLWTRFWSLRAFGPGGVLLWAKCFSVRSFLVVLLHRYAMDGMFHCPPKDSMFHCSRFLGGPIPLIGYGFCYILFCSLSFGSYDAVL